ncbi:unnamed protein product [Dovyalis caffra]|uniref:Uncharacterized protein n=1 Tax=Dovyalis caffra TaxID=77055 RepID=A0AAV1R4B2_9ROSI|nr:unnamed protein product [Dovyalis caffra]
MEEHESKGLSPEKNPNNFSHFEDHNEEVKADRKEVSRIVESVSGSLALIT